MTVREIYDLALRGGGNDFQATVELLERLGEPWCLIGCLANPAARPVVLEGLEGEVTALAIRLDSHWLVTGGVDKTARLWDHPSQNR
jgi:WD40 repeat protein